MRDAYPHEAVVIVDDGDFEPASAVVTRYLLLSRSAPLRIVDERSAGLFSFELGTVVCHNGGLSPSGALLLAVTSVVILKDGVEEIRLTSNETK